MPAVLSSPGRPTLNYLLTMAHGAEHYRQEAVYLLLSWLAQRDPAADPCTALVATDKPETFTDILGERADIVYLPLAPAQLLAWRGGAAGYVHRIKPQLIAHAAASMALGRDDALLFVDSDAAFVADPAPLFQAIRAGKAVMDTREGSIEDSRRLTRSHGRLHEMARNCRFDFGGERQRPLAPGLSLWNSGAVGLPGDEVAGIMAETLALTDQITRAQPRLAMAEQIALSAVLDARARPIAGAAACLLHYHAFKEFRADIAAFLARYAGARPGEWIVLAAQIDPRQRMQPKLAFNRLPKWRRQLIKHLGRGWRRQPYPWEA